MQKTETRTIQLTQIADAEIQVDGMTIPVPLTAMTCVERTLYDHNEVLGERTAGQQSNEARLAWSGRGGWDLFCRQLGGPQVLRDREFTLSLTAVPAEGATPCQYTFDRFCFRAETSASYGRFYKAEVA